MSEEKKEEEAEEKPESKEVEELKLLFEEKKKEVEQLRTQMLYLQADFENFRKRKEREIGEIKRLLLADFMKNMLPIVDDFESMEKNLKGIDGSVLSGLIGLKKNFLDVLTKMGLSEISLAKFDPNFHEVEAVVDAEEDDVIVEVVRKGYTANGILLRPAKVIVGKRRVQESSTK